MQRAASEVTHFFQTLVKNIVTDTNTEEEPEFCPDSGVGRYATAVTDQNSTNSLFSLTFTFPLMLLNKNHRINKVQPDKTASAPFNKI